MGGEKEHEQQSCEASCLITSFARDNSSEVPLYLYSFFRLTSRKIVGKFLFPASWQAPTLHLAARQLLVVGEEVAVPLVDLACPVKGCALH